MMKRLGALVSLALLVAALACPFAYAAGSELEMVSLSPKDGQSGLQPANVAIKMSFNQNMTSKEAQKANEDCFKIVDEKGKKAEYIAVYDAKKYPNDIWLVLKKDTKPNTEYTFTISKDLVSSDGTTLGKKMETTFKIRNTATDGTINMVMMVVMMGGMVFFTSAEQKRKLKKEKEENMEDANLNPYKIAKERGVSVDEAVKIVAKEREKLEKKRAKMQKEAEEAEEDPYVQRVSKRRPIAAVGGKTPQSVLAKKQAKREREEKIRQERLARELERQRRKNKKK